MSEDFDKSDSPTGIDFHEAQRLFIERFEETYPDFIVYLNKRILESGLQTRFSLEFNQNETIYGRTNLQQSDPSRSQCWAYLQKKGFDCSWNWRNRRVSVDWSRRDGGMYPS